MSERRSVAEFDKNMEVVTTITEPDLVWLSVREAPFTIYGVFYDEEQGCFVRMPQSVADTVSAGVAHLNHHTCGGRVRFVTDSPCIAIHAVMQNQPTMDHFALTGQSGFDLYHKTEEGDVYYRSFRPPVGVKEGYSSLIPTPAELSVYTINFPLYDTVQELYIGLKKDAVLEAAPGYAHAKPAVFYGSSITQGGCASRPGNAYEAILSRRLDLDHINLGFSGNGKGEKEICEYIAHMDMSIFVCDYDHNAYAPDHLQKTHLPLLRAVREAQPDLPILVVSAPDSLLKPEWRPRKEIIRKNVELLQSKGDQNILFLDGATLFAGDGWDSCTVDGCHPNDLGFWRMAMAMEPYIRRLLKI